MSPDSPYISFVGYEKMSSFVYFHVLFSSPRKEPILGTEKGHLCWRPVVDKVHAALNWAVERR